MQICMLPEIFYSGISGSYSPFLKLCRILSKGSVRKKPQGNRGCVNLFLLLWMEVSMHKHKYYSIFFLYKMTNIHMSGWNNKKKTRSIFAKLNENSRNKLEGLRIRPRKTLIKI